MKRSIKSTQIEMLQFELSKTGLGTPVLAGPAKLQCSIADNGVGDYTISWSPAYMQAPVVVCTPSTDNTIVKLGTKTNSSIQILTEDLTGVAAEGDFDCLIMGSGYSSNY